MDAKIAWRSAGNADECPVCHSSSIDWGQVDTFDGVATQESWCQNCGAHWNFFYQVMGVTGLINKSGDGESTEAYIDFHDILQQILDHRELLPLLMGVHEQLDQLIELKLKES